MRCSDVEALWDEMRAGMEPPNEIVLAHLRRCRTCQAIYEEFEGVAYCLTCLPIVEPPSSLVPRILEHIAAIRGHQRSTVPDNLATVDSPLGMLAIAWRGAAITFVGIDRGDDRGVMHALIERRLRRTVRSAEMPEWVRDVVTHFFDGWSVDADRLDISDLSTFEQAALRKAAQIPPGEVRSYGWIAREIGHPQSARAVGQAMARNPVALLYPCHRVVDASGALHHYLYGVDIKARLLKMEGYPTAPERVRRTSGV